MSPSRARSASNVPEFDPYGYSPFDPNYEGAHTDRGYDYDRSHHSDDEAEDRKHSSRRHHRSSNDARRDDDHHHDSHGRRHNSPNTGRKRNSSSAKVKDSYPSKEADDDQWDTDYDPRDKYYLSGDEHDYDYLSPTRAYQRENYQPHKAAADRSSRHRRDDRRGETRGSGRRGLARRESAESTTTGRRSGGASRPSRPRAVSRYSSYGSSSAKPRSRYPPNASRSKAAAPKPVERIPWEQLARCAVKAGAIAALKVHNQPGPWIGEKGTKVASAALGAAVVDTFLAKKHPKKKGGVRHAAMRQVAELAIGNMVAGPAMKRGGRLKR